MRVPGKWKCPARVGGRVRRAARAVWAGGRHIRHGRNRAPSSRRSLARQAAGALGWSFTNSVVAKLGTVGVGIMLARLLGPHSFGTYAVASVALNILSNFNDLGVGLAITCWPGEPREIAPTVTTVSVLTSVALYGGCFFGAPAYAAAMGAPSATGVVRTLSLIVVIDGFSIVPAGLLQRYFRQGQRMISDQVNIWLGTVVTAALALAGFGPMSLAIGRLVGCLAAVILLVRFSPEPLRFGFNRRQAPALLRFGLPLAGSGGIAFAIANLDQLVVGRTLGVTALGFFVLATNFSNWPAAAFTEPISRVAPSTLARLQHDPPAMRAGFEAMLSLVSAVTLPVCFVEAGCAAPLIGLVYGTRWLPAGQPLTWLALLAALQIFFQLTFDYFVVLAKSRVIFTLQLVWLAVLIPGLIAGARVHGIAGVALAEVAVAAVVPLPWYLLELRRDGSKGRVLAGRLGLPLAGALGAGLVAAAATALVPNPLTAIFWGALAGLLVIGLLLLRMRGVLGALRSRYAQAGEQDEPGDRNEQDERSEQNERNEPGGEAGPGVAAGPVPVVTATLAPGVPGSLLLRPDITESFPGLEDAGAAGAPLYRETVDFLRWDPAGQGNGRDRSREGPADGPGLSR
jgi:O-antigen/teichoic acid export membrane protein